MKSVYCDSVYKYNPIELWSFSDKANFIELADKENKNFLLWEAESNIESIQPKIKKFFNNSSNPILPFPGKGEVSSIYFNEEVPTTDYSISISNKELLNFIEFSNTKNTFYCSFFVYSSESINSISICPINSDKNPIVTGYSNTGNEILAKELKFTIDQNKWKHIVATFNCPAKQDKNGEAFPPIFGLKITFNFLQNIKLNNLLIGGISVAQNKQPAISINNGQVIGNPPTMLNLPENIGVVNVKEYGLGKNNAYILTKNNDLLAENYGIPMIFGERSSTFLHYGENIPSIIIPGKGIFHQDGIGRNSAIEFWIRIRNESDIPSRIFGQLYSNDGLYIAGTNIIMIFGNNIASYDVKNTFAPMLLHIGFNQNTVNVFLNGKQIISLPNLKNDLPNNDNQITDWLGFFKPENIEFIELGPVAIYDKQSSTQELIERYNLGQLNQGVISGNTASFYLENANHNKSTTIDFNFGKADHLESILPIIPKTYSSQVVIDIEEDQQILNNKVFFSKKENSIDVNINNTLKFVPTGFFIDADINLANQEFINEEDIRTIVSLSFMKTEYFIQICAINETIFIRDCIKINNNITNYEWEEFTGLFISTFKNKILTQELQSIFKIKVNNFIGLVSNFGLSSHFSEKQSISNNNVGAYTVSFNDNYFTKQVEILSYGKWVGNLKLSSLSNIYYDRGGRIESHIDFIQAVTNTSNKQFKIWLVAKKSNKTLINNFSDLAKVPIENSELITIENINTAYEIKNNSVIEFNLKNPHLYDLEVHIEAIGSSITKAELEQISFFAINKNNIAFPVIESYGELSAYPQPVSGINNINSIKTKFAVGKSKNTMLFLDEFSGLSSVNGNILIYGDKNISPIFLGAQVWIKWSGKRSAIKFIVDDTTQVEFNIADGEIETAFPVINDNFTPDFTIFQDGQQVSSLVLRKNQWTSVIFCLDSPKDINKNIPKIEIGPGISLSFVAIYQQNEMPNISYFNSWHDILFQNNVAKYWQDYAIDNDVYKTWLEILVTQQNAFYASMNKKYLMLVGQDQLIVYDENNKNYQKINIVHYGINVLAKQVQYTEGQNGTRLVLSTPQWKNIGQYRQ